MQTLKDVAISYHELYLSLLEAGFSRDQSTYLVANAWFANILVGPRA